MLGSSSAIRTCMRLWTFIGLSVNSFSVWPISMVVHDGCRPLTDRARADRGRPLAAFALVLLARQRYVRRAASSSVRDQHAEADGAPPRRAGPAALQPRRARRSSTSRPGLRGYLLTRDAQLPRAVRERPPRLRQPADRARRPHARCRPAAPPRRPAHRGRRLRRRVRRAAARARVRPARRRAGRVDRARASGGSTRCARASPRSTRPSRCSPTAAATAREATATRTIVLAATGLGGSIVLLLRARPLPAAGGAAARAPRRLRRAPARRRPPRRARACDRPRRDRVPRLRPSTRWPTRSARASRSCGWPATASTASSSTRPRSSRSRTSQGRYLLVGRSWLEAIGRTPDEVLGRTDAELMDGRRRLRLARHGPRGRAHRRGARVRARRRHARGLALAT